MFGWFERKQIKEIKKLIFQNGAAAKGGINVYFEGDKKTSARLEQIREENRRIALSFYESGLVSPVDLKMLLDMNRELRRVLS